MRSVSHALVTTFAETSVKNVKTDTIWQPTLQARSQGGFLGQCTPKFLCPPKFCCAQKNLFQTYNKYKNLAS